MYYKNKAIRNDVKLSMAILAKILYENIKDIEGILNDKSIEYFVLYKIKKLKLELEETYYYIYIKFIETIKKEISMDKNYDLENIENLLRELNNIKITMLTNSQSTLNENIKNFKRATQIKEDIFNTLELAEEEIKKVKDINYNQEYNPSINQRAESEKSEDISKDDNENEYSNIGMLRGSKETIENDTPSNETSNPKSNYYNNVIMSSSFMYSKEDDR